MTVAEQKGTIHEVTNAGELVGGDDGGDTVLRRFVHGASDGNGSAPMCGVVDEHDVARSRCCEPNVRRH
jgi:hypothetical protein